jgi:hypothetical protein
MQQGPVSQGNALPLPCSRRTTLPEQNVASEKIRAEGSLLPRKEIKEDRRRRSIRTRSGEVSSTTRVSHFCLAPALPCSRNCQTVGRGLHPRIEQVTRTLMPEHAAAGGRKLCAQH